jgi:hypothetical protein
MNKYLSQMFDNLYNMCEFLENFDLKKFTQEEIDNLNNFRCNKEIG